MNVSVIANIDLEEVRSMRRGNYKFLLDMLSPGFRSDSFLACRERLLDILRIPHSHQVPVLVCMTDVCGVDDSALKEVRKVRVCKIPIIIRKWDVCGVDDGSFGFIRKVSKGR